MQSQTVSLPELTDDVLTILFSFCNATDILLSITLCNKRFCSLVQSEKIFKTENWKNRKPEKLATKLKEQGRTHLDTSDLQKAILCFTRSLIVYPKDHLCFFWRGYAYAEDGKFLLAINDFSRSLELDPNDVTTYSNRGATYRDIGEHEKAISDLDAALNLDPLFASAHNNKGVVFGDLGFLDAAINSYTSALEIDPEHAIARRNRARKYQKVGKFNEAYDDFVKLQALNPKDNEGNRFFVCLQIKGIRGFKKPLVLEKLQQQMPDIFSV